MEIWKNEIWKIENLEEWKLNIIEIQKNENFKKYKLGKMQFGKMQTWKNINSKK